MEITINAQHTILDSAISVLSLLETHGYSGKLVAVAINGEFIPKSTYETRIIENKDVIEIVAPMQGG